MNRYGCWDCGSEVAPFQGRCVVCGWPAPAPRRKTFRAGVLISAALLAVFGLSLALPLLAVEAFLPDSGGPEPREHRWTQPHMKRSLFGSGRLCGNCGIPWERSERDCGGMILEYRR